MEQCGQVEVFRLLLLCWLVGGPVQGQVRHPLPMLWMMPVTSGSGRENLTAAVMPAVQLALQDLKKQPPPLGNYDIQLQLLDSQVGVTHLCRDQCVNSSLSLAESPSTLCLRLKTLTEHFIRFSCISPDMTSILLCLQACF